MKRRTRRWGRILFNTLTAISLLLAIATAGLWALSYRYQVSWDRSVSIAHQGRTKHEEVRFVVVNGRCEWEYRWSEFGVAISLNPSYTNRPPKVLRKEGQWTWRRVNGKPFPLTKLQRRWWPSLEMSDLPTAKDRLLSIPLWAPATLLFAVVGFWSVQKIASRRQASRRKQAGHCPACGYDIRANPAKCSECGQEVAKQT